MSAFTKAIALCAALLALTAADAAACSCIQIDARTQLRQSDGAFVGRLVSVTPRPTGNPSIATFRYAIVKGYKRAPRSGFITVRAQTQGSACGLPTRTGRRYALFADRRNRRWTSSLCQTTTAARLAHAAHQAKGSSAAPGTGCAGPAS